MKRSVPRTLRLLQMSPSGKFKPTGSRRDKARQRAIRRILKPAIEARFAQLDNYVSPVYRYFEGMVEA